jgi:lipoprotein-releasing system ATP-binding protein
MGAISVLKGVDFEARWDRLLALCGPIGLRQEHAASSVRRPRRAGPRACNGQRQVEVNRHHRSLRLLRHEVGFVFQLHNLIPDLTLEENCLIPTVAAGIDRRARASSCSLRSELA